MEYYYKDTPLYFKNESGTALTNVTATFYKLENGTPTPTDSQTIGPVDAGKLAAQQIRIPDNESRFVQFSWNNGQGSALYDFTTDYTEGSTPAAQKLDLTTQNCYVYNGTENSWVSTASDLLKTGNKIYFDATLSEYSYKGEGPEIERAAMPGAEGTLYCLLTGPNSVTSQEMKPETTATAPTDPTPTPPPTPPPNASCGLAKFLMALTPRCNSPQRMTKTPPHTTRPRSTARQKSPSPARTLLLCRRRRPVGLHGRQP
ncbi:hypothetical protein NIA69_20040 [Gemmiger formicilis]|nr:hypothetical protein [Gemmiger formicilis]